MSKYQFFLSQNLCFKEFANFRQGAETLFGWTPFECAFFYQGLPLPAERLEGEEGADDDEGEDEGAVIGSILAAHPGLLNPKHGFNF